MISVDVWQGIERLAFHENAILLDAKLRSQGDPTRSAIQDHDHVEFHDGLTPQLIRNVLDDFALVVSGNGGKENVSAACLEYDEELRTITFRVSSNDGIEKPRLADLQRILQLITNSSSPHTEVQLEEVLILILQQCATSFLKHVSKFLNELKQAQCPPNAGLRFPGFSFHDGTAEPATDIDHLGPYNRDSHRPYMQLSSERLQILREVSANLTTSGTKPDFSKMGLLAKAAQNVQRSSSFDRFLRYNLLASRKPMAVQSMAQSLKERLGKMSRIWRAAKTLTAFGSAMMTDNVTVNLSCLPASRHPVRELCKRTPAQLKSRGGLHFQSCNNAQLQGRLDQWQSYRLHCEIQLLIFYQENPQLQLRSHYIGCNKLACYLCYNFINNHGQFQVKGCHQGLYSLWTVPHIINFERHEQANEFRKALRQLAHILESKVNTIRNASKSQWKYRTNYESTANLSRMTLPWPTIVASVTKAQTEATNARESRRLFQPENPRRGYDSSNGDKKKLEKTSSAHVLEDEFATQSAQRKALHHVPSLVASTVRTCGNNENDTDERPSWEIDNTLSAPTKGRNPPTAANPSTSPPLLDIEISDNHSSLVSWSQDNAPAKASQEMGQSHPTLPSDSTSLVPQTCTWMVKQCSEYQDEEGVEETSSPAQRQRQVRLSTDLVYEQNYRSAHIIGDHESRTSDKAAKDGTEMSRTFDFHEMGLSVEVECPRSAQMIIVPCSSPQNSKGNPVVEVDKIEPGESLDFDMGKDLSKTRAMFLKKRQNNGIDQWWECRWKCC